MSLVFVSGNYGGKTANTSTYVKTFNPSSGGDKWVYAFYNNKKIITTSDHNIDVYIQKDLYIQGNLIQLSDERFKKNIEPIPENECELLMRVNPCKYEFIESTTNESHYGFIAQEVEKLFPTLVKATIDVNTKKEKKAVNYLEFIPLLLLKIQDLQKQVDELKDKDKT
jgi:hypothetical protein